MVQRTATQITANQASKEDHLVKLLGHFGKWQFIVFSSVFLVKFSSGWVQMAILFLTPNFTFWCVKFSNNETNVALNSTCYKDCLEYDYDTSPFDNTIISEWDLVCDRLWMASFTQTMLQLGVLIGSILFGFLSDRYGRRYTFLLAVTAVIAFGLGIPFSPNYYVFTAQRFFLGVATAGTMVISFVIVMETIGSKYREILGCIFHIPFVLGHLTVPLFAYYFRSWDTYSLALAIPPVLYLGYFFLLSESPRWLISVGRVEEATAIVKRAAEINNFPTNDIEETLTKMSNEITSKAEGPKANYKDLFRSTLRVKTICSCFIWLVSGLTFFGFNQYISQTSRDPFISVAAAGAIQIPSNLVAICLIRQFGRKVTTISFLCLCGLCILTLGCVPNIFWLTLTLGTLGVSCAAVVSVAIYIHTSELFPTVVRNMGVGACSTSMRVGSMIAPFISNISMTVPWLPTVIFGFAPIAAGVMCLWLPETKGTALPDSIEEIRTGD